MEDAAAIHYPGCVTRSFFEQVDGPRRGDAPRTSRRREQEFLGEIFREIVRNAMNINDFDVYDLATAQRAPSVRNPLLLNVAIHQHMQMGNATFVEFKNGDVLD